MNFAPPMDRPETAWGGLWLSFKRHLRFLKETGFVDEADRLTPDGQWASNLRLDQPLLIAEAIRKGRFTIYHPAELAGGLAPFVWDRGQEIELKVEGILDLHGIETVFYRLLNHIEVMRILKEKRGFESSPILFCQPPPCSCGQGESRGKNSSISWLRTREIWHRSSCGPQTISGRVADLRESHPRLASVAGKAIDLILREPVYIL